HYRFRDTLDGIYRQARGYGESQVLLYKKYKSLASPKPWTENIKTWLRLLKHFRLSSSKEDHARLLWQLGWRVGRLHGSFKYQVL
ncbi:MAG: hypothetical protein QNJ41_24205, partial [Xenococcaceae cyanobacterium MO_188.B32]|nr:hypothetical protein [Xenococcaceae cyanobacterium MO_188.B32]